MVFEGSVDAVFLDLPSPERAIPHAYRVLKRHGKLCNFSPCIEQVQKAVAEMARQGFYEIRTYETLARDFMVSSYGYDSFHKEEQKQEQLNRRQQKQKDKQMLVTAPKAESRGHTGYLTFAIKF